MSGTNTDNQSPPLCDYNVFSTDRALAAAVEREGLVFARDELVQLGELAGSAQVQTWATQANTNPPLLQQYDRYGDRIDEVAFHPSWHRLMEVATRFGLHGAPWNDTRPGAHALRAAKFYVWGQAEAGHGCPISMTYAAVPTLRAQAQVSRTWEPRLTACEYDPRLLPIGQKKSALCGMAMTEKQGGSDVRANSTRATFVENTAEGDAYVLHGHKWFCSAPMCDAFLVLAQTSEGLTCFLMPRVLPDGTRNRIFIQRLKEKLGNRSNASSELELDGARALRVGQAGHGVKTIVEMVNYTRLDCMNGSAALVRSAVAQAIHHCTYRRAFGKRLVEQPLMQNVLADLALESEAALLFVMRVARAVDRAPHDPREAAVKRLGTALGKYWICKRAPAVVGEALECLGGNGYVEDFGLARLYREAPLNSIWEGSGNVNALDVLRAIGQPETMEAFAAEIEPLKDHPIVRAAGETFTGGSGSRVWATAEPHARQLAEAMAVKWQGALLVRYAPPELAAAFIDSRMRGRSGHTLGTLLPGADFAAIVDRAAPQAQARGR